MSEHPHDHGHHHHHHADDPPPQMPLIEQDPAQASLVAALRGGFNLLRVFMIVLVALYIWSGVFQVNENEQGLIARFGKLRTHEKEGQRTPVFGPGWYVALPRPFDQQIRVPGTMQQLTTTHFLFRHGPDEQGKRLEEILPVGAQNLTPGQDGAMLTGDRNLSHGRWTVRYRITDPADFVEHIPGDPDDPNGFSPLLERLFESAIVRDVAGRTVDAVIREEISSMQNSVQNRLQASLDRLQAGVSVIAVEADTIEPGGLVREAFIDVTNAENQSQAMRDRAREQAAEILNAVAGGLDTREAILSAIRAYGDAQAAHAPAAELDARRAAVERVLMDMKDRGVGDVAVLLREAEADAASISRSIEREYEEFVDYLALRKTRPRITLLERWTEMRRDILGNRRNEVFYVPGKDVIEILVNRDPRRQIAQQEQDIAERQGRGPKQIDPGAPAPRRPSMGPR